MGVELKDISKKVRQARKTYDENGKKVKVTQYDLARMSGLSIRSIQNIEQGKSSASIYSLLRIAVALKKTIGYIL